ncbi:MAG TPA: class I SAM-dependent methyltransferase [Azospirillum sp.]
MDMDRFFALHAGLPRQAPGSDAVTQEALRRLRPHGLPDDPVALDIGCGPGRSLMMLARVTGGRVTGIDVHPPFLAEAQRRINEAGLGRRAWAERCSMTDLGGYPPGMFDLLWGEGSIYIVGFGEGLERWRHLLKPGGLAAFSELTWLTENPPADARAFWADAYPRMATEAANREAAARAGYRVLDTFTLPPSAWWDEYYGPLEARIAEIRERDPRDEDWAAVLDAEQAEIDLYRRFGASYGYVFYLLRRAD